MSLKFLQNNWEQFAQEDPLWAVMTVDDKKGNKWQIDEFFQTGVQEIDIVMKKYQQYLKGHERALDFGCGVGRLTQALNKHFDEAYGIDIAPTMIDLANKYNQSPKCHFIVNDTNELRQFPDNHFDFIYSNITFQHMRAGYTKKYLEEFIRILKPGGLAVFQLPSHLTNQSFSKKFKQYLRANLPTFLIKMWTKGQPWMDMNAIPKDEIVRFLEDHQTTILDITQNNLSSDYWQSYSYCFTKK